MTQDKAYKIAATLVKQFSHERYFALSLPKFEDLDMIAKTLREDFACTVAWNLMRNKISVHCPEVPKDEPQGIDLVVKERARLSS